MKLSGLWIRHVALGLVCLLLLSAFQTASALPSKGKGIGSHRSGSGKGSHGIEGLLSGHDDKKGGRKDDDKKHGLGGLFGHDDKKGKPNDDDKKHGLGGLFGHDDKKNNDKHGDKKHGLGGLFGHDDKNGDKSGKGKGKGKHGDKNPNKGKHGKDKCKASKKGSSRGRKPSPRDLEARDLALRADSDYVGQDDMKYSRAHTQTLHTNRLRTCIGIVITGEEGILQNWLLHVSATDFQVDDAMSKLKRNWDLMGPKKNVKVYFSSPDPDPCKSDEGARDLIPQSVKISDHLEHELKSLTGSTPRVIHRPARDRPSGHEGTMVVDGDGQVFVEGHRVN